MAQVDYSVFDSNGRRSSLEQITGQFQNIDVLFVGESHDDSVGHRIQFELFKAAVDKYGKNRSIALSLEMFDRDVQDVVDEYLKGLISERHFLAASRPWGNYKSDYRPMVEYAKKHGIPVIASNAPRRYVNMVARLGRGSLSKLSPEARRWIAPIPYGQPSKEYQKKFKSLMASMSDDASATAHNPMMDSQVLWDATMAYSISGFLGQNESPLVIHLNGSFHSESRLGIPEHLVGYRKGTKFAVVTMRYETRFSEFDKTKHTNLGDFIILTDGSAPRSKR